MSMLVGLDLGTQSLKAVVVDTDGDALVVRGHAAVAYGVDLPAPHHAEQDPAAWLSALAPAIDGALLAAGIGPADVRALAVAGQLDGCVPLDRAGRAHGPCLIWMDRRATAELPALEPRAFLATTGQVLDAGHLAAKARWLDRHRPGVARFTPPVGFVVAQLTGAHVIDHALASTTNLYDLHARAWSAPLCAAFDLDPARLPRIAAATDVAGALTPAGAALTGLPAGLPVAVGTGDDFATPLGAGVVAPGVVVGVLGTAEVVGALAATPAPVLDEGDEPLVETHAYPAGGWFVENPGWLAGGAVRWLAGLCNLDPARGDAAVDALALAAPPGAAGVTFLPALSGATAPRWDAQARAAFAGLTAAHGPEHLARAVLEACAFAMRDVVIRLEALGLPAAQIVLAGGGARSAAWAQIRADILDLPVARATPDEACAMGAAMLAAVAAGAAPDLAACAARIAPPVTVATPTPAARAACDEAYGRYRALYDALRPTFGP